MMNRIIISLLVLSLMSGTIGANNKPVELTAKDMQEIARIGRAAWISGVHNSRDNSFKGAGAGALAGCLISGIYSVMFKKMVDDNGTPLTDAERAPFVRKDILRGTLYGLLGGFFVGGTIGLFNQCYDYLNKNGRRVINFSRYPSIAESYTREHKLHTLFVAPIAWRNIKVDTESRIKS